MSQETVPQFCEDGRPLDLGQWLHTWAAHYETIDFMAGDPSRFMHHYENPRDVELAAFIAACLSFGKRTEILRHIDRVIDGMGDSPAEWLLADGYEALFPDGRHSFYRMVSHEAMRTMCGALKRIVADWGSLGARCREAWQQGETRRFPGRLAAVMGQWFPRPDCNFLVPSGKWCACKRLNLFLRWMVRRNSPVDVGLWNWYPQEELLMPMDTHVIAVAKRLGLLPANAKADLHAAIELTEKMKTFFPGDPVKADFALFGYGVEDRS